MATARETHTENVVLGAGEIFIDQYDSNGNPTGAERYLGDSIGATISLTTERTTIQSGDGAVARDLVDVVRSVSRTLGFTLHDSSIANWNLFVLGEVAEQSIAAAEAMATIAKPKVGFWHQLGQSAANPSGPGEIDKIVLGKVKIADNPTASSPTYEAATQAEFNALEFDLRTARMIVHPSRAANAAAGISERADLAGKGIEISYSPSAARKISQAKATAAASQITCAIRYVEVEPIAGNQGRNVYARKCNLIPGGEAALKSRDTEQQLAFTANVLDPGSTDGYPPLVIDGIER